MNEILHRQLRKRRPTTQDECVAIAVRQSLATYGKLEGRQTASACLGMVKGLFGPAYHAADGAQKARWFRMAKEQYRLATKRV